jgi:hypothetical protein
MRREVRKKIYNIFSRIIFKLFVEEILNIYFSCRKYPLLVLEGGFKVSVDDENYKNINRYIRNKLESSSLNETKTIIL